MIDRRLVMLIEKCGYVSQHGKRVYGTAALLHFLHRPIPVSYTHLSEPAYRQIDSKQQEQYFERPTAVQ